MTCLPVFMRKSQHRGQGFFNFWLLQPWLLSNCNVLIDIAYILTQNSCITRPRTREIQSIKKQPRKIQQSLFDQQPKRGRPPTKPHGHFGGRYLKNYNPKYDRPMDSKKALHLVLKSSQATGEKSFKSEKYEAKIWGIISHHAEKTGIKIYEYANGGNHLHLLLHAKHRDDYTAFIRAITGLIARTVGESERGKPLKKKFWDARPFSRIVGYAKKEFSAMKTYLLRNTLEAIGWIRYISRDSQMPVALRQLLIAGNANSA